MKHEVEDQDVVVMATDGVLDNLFDQDIVSCLKPNLVRFRDA